MNTNPRTPIWNARTDYKANAPDNTKSGSLVLHDDGNLVVYDSNTPRTSKWNSGTNVGNNWGPFKLSLRDDGNLVLYNKINIALWFSKFILKPGELIYSNNGLYKLIYQTDGNLVLYDNNIAIWNAWYPNNPLPWNPGNRSITPGYAELQDDGNFVIYNNNKPPEWLWQTRTWLPGSINGPFRISLRDDRNLVIYNRTGSPTWSTGSNITTTPIPTTTQIPTTSQIRNTTQIPTTTIISTTTPISTTSTTRIPTTTIISTTTPTITSAPFNKNNLYRLVAGVNSLVLSSTEKNYLFIYTTNSDYPDQKCNLIYVRTKSFNEYQYYIKSQEKYVYSSSTINAIGILSHKNTFDESSVFTFIPSGSGYLIQVLIGNFIKLVQSIVGRLSSSVILSADRSTATAWSVVSA